MTDRTTRALLLAIALGLWANVAGAWLRPTVVSAGAQGIPDLYVVMSGIQSSVSTMESALARIQRGTCTNDKIC